MHHLPTSIREKLFKHSWKDVGRKKNLILPTSIRADFLKLSEGHRQEKIESIELEYPPRVDPLSSWSS